jgi:transposase
MRPVQLRDDQWRKIRRFLRTCPKAYVGNEEECRRFVEAVLWMARSGAPWRYLPESYGRWNTVYKRFVRWCEQGIWDELQHHVAHDPDLEHLIVDTTVVRAHPCAAGAPAKRGARHSRRWAGAAAGSAPRST